MNLNKLFRLVFLFILFFILHSTFCIPVSAQNTNDNFDISLHATYNVQETGNTKVTQDFTIVNKSPQYFIEEYAVIVGSNKIQNVAVFENNKKLDANVVSTTNQTSISIKFTDKNVGQGKKRTFTVQYNSDDISTVSGQALEVSIPRLAKDSPFSEYKVSIKTPLKFGGPSKSNPPSSDWTVSSTGITTEFSDLHSESVSVFYGREQYYQASLRYNLKNPTDSTGIMQIALPPDTKYQKVQFIDINPQPKKIELDEDGNWIASYQLAGQEELSINLSAYILVGLDKIDDYPQTPILNTYTKSDKFWPTDDKKIKAATDKLSDTRSVYEFVIETLNYNYQKVGELNLRLGAKSALDNPNNSTCQEFTDLFITLARAKDIPARRLTGYAFTQNEILRPLSLIEDVLHTWPEYYDKEKNEWESVDPTWENTTGGINYFDQFDLNHIVFAINGSSSETPYPAGSYKIPGKESKDVDVKFANNFPGQSFQVETNIENQKIYGLPWLGHYNLTIRNITGQAWYNLDLKINPENSDVLVNYKQDELKALLPFQTLSVPFTVKKNNWLLAEKEKLTLNLNQNEIHYEARTQSQLNQIIFNPLIIISLGGVGIVFTLTAGSVLVFRKKR